MKLALLSIFLALPLLAQDVRVTSQTLSAQTTAAMFGRLPKAVTAAAVQVCSNENAALTIPQARIVQQVKANNGYTVLPKDAAIVVVAAAQGHSKLQTTVRYGLAAVELAGLASGWSGLSAAWKNTLTSAAIAGGGGISIISTAIPTHTLLTFSNEMLPDPIALAPLGCAGGYALVEANSGAKSVDFGMVLPTGAKP